ncbi:MAG: hypothetical protein JWL59_2281 [Chthoniobacteraceae bacterium]|nr:hypothetical protein [Chthoniobacteraceae bacterium]
MSLFQLDPAAIAERVRAAKAPVNVPSLAASLWRGVIGFTIVSVAGFAPWALFGRWFYQRIGEAGLYSVCAFMFIGLSGLLLHRLIIGPGSLIRFYKLFSIAFASYSIAWIVGWMMLHGHPGSLAGLFAGTALMGWILATAFEARGSVLKVIAALFVLNSLGYFLGGWIEGCLIPMKECSIMGIPLARPAQVMVAKLQWGICYGIGLGAGLGLAFHLCQEPARKLLAVKSKDR